MTGGIGTILVVLAVAWIWPEIREIGMNEFATLDGRG